MKFSSVEVEPAKPSKVVVLPPAAFADDWGPKPKAEVAIGLRFISEADLQAARLEAAREAVNFYEGRDGGECIDEAERDEAYNEALICHAVALGTCSANDVKKPYFEMAEETVKRALTSEGVKRVWDELVVLHVGRGVNFEKISNDDALLLARTLRAGFLERLPDRSQAEARKLLAHVLQEMREYFPDDVEKLQAAEPGTDDGGEEEDEGVYYARAGA